MKVHILKVDGDGFTGEGRFVAESDAEQAIAQLQEKLDREDDSHAHTIDQRDAAEDAVSEAYMAVTGEAAEWSNLFGFADAIERIEETMHALRNERDAALADAGRLDCLEARRGEVRGFNWIARERGDDTWTELLHGSEHETLREAIDALQSSEGRTTC